MTTETTDETISIERRYARVMAQYYAMRGSCDCCGTERHIDELIGIGSDESDETEMNVCPPCADWLGLPICGRCGGDLEEPGDFCIACGEEMSSREYIAERRAEARGLI